MRSDEIKNMDLSLVTRHLSLLCDDDKNINGGRFSAACRVERRATMPQEVIARIESIKDQLHLLRGHL